MKTFLISLIFTLIISNIYGQTDPKSKSLLQKTSTINNGYNTITSDFKITTTDLQSGKTNIEQGDISIKGEKYCLKLKKSLIIFDGKSIYNYLSESNEVNITNPEPAKIENGDFFISNPRDIFKFYTKNFKSKWIKETLVNNNLCNEIELYPINLKTKYTKIVMLIDKNLFNIAEIKVFFKDGTRQNIEFVNFKANSTIPDSKFIFDSSKYQGIIINDMRF